MEECYTHIITRLMTGNFFGKVVRYVNPMTCSSISMIDADPELIGNNKIGLMSKFKS